MLSQKDKNITGIEKFISHDEWPRWQEKKNSLPSDCIKLPRNQDLFDLSDCV